MKYFWVLPKDGARPPSKSFIKKKKKKKEASRYLDRRWDTNSIDFLMTGLGMLIFAKLISRSQAGSSYVRQIAKYQNKVFINVRYEKKYDKKVEKELMNVREN